MSNMEDAWQLVLLDEAQDSARALACAERAADYIEMESGRVPDALWVRGFFNDAPPGRGKDDMLLMGVALPDERLIGLIGLSPGYETADEWYIGLLLIDESHRNAGLGSAVLGQIKALAAKARAKRLKVAVFTQNGAALRFWARHGFEALRAGHANTDESAPDRIVLQAEI